MAAVEGKLDDKTLNAVVRKAGGNPLFIEELVKTVLDAGVSAIREGETVPATLDALLMARLDRLGKFAKHVAQLAATLGREFPHSLLALVAEIPPDALREATQRLLQADLLLGGAPPGGMYTFKHSLIQDAAYQSLLKSERRTIHGRVAEILKTHFQQRVANEPELLAYHLVGAGAAIEAAELYRRAGRREAERAAVEEATTHYRSGLSALETAPSGLTRDELEMSLQILLGNRTHGCSRVQLS